MTFLPFVHDTPSTRVVFGSGRRRELTQEVERLGARRVLLIAGRHDTDLSAELAEGLGELLVAHVDEVVMHVPAAVAARALEAATAADADLIVAAGGGSAIGLAKAVARHRRTRILALPTTYAGSEMTQILGITEAGRKRTVNDEALRPQTVIYDPELTLGLPRDLSANSGMNALAHLVEGLYAPGVSPLSVVTAQEGIRALASALPRVMQDPMDRDARADALAGAWLGGWVLGTTGMGVHHTICHVLGGTFDLPHAPTHAAVLPYATAYNAEVAPEAMRRIAHALTEAFTPESDAATGLWSLGQHVGATTSLRALGLPHDALEPAVDLVVEANPVNPRPLDRESLLTLLEAAYWGNPPRLLIGARAQRIIDAGARRAES